MITPYEKIKFLLEMNVYKGVEVRQGRMIIAIVTRIDTIDVERVNSIDDFLATPIPNPPKLLPVGTKVRVFEEWVSNQQDGTTSLKTDTIYFVLQVCDIDYRYGIRYNEGQCERVPSRAVYPVWED